MIEKFFLEKFFLELILTEATDYSLWKIKEVKKEF